MVIIKQGTEPNSRDLLPLPPRPLGRTTIIRDWYDHWRPQIEDELKKLGEEGVCARWQIKKYQLRRRLKRWAREAPKNSESTPVTQVTTYHVDPKREREKQAILADYRTMPIKSFLARWHMTSSTWKKIKKEWGVIGRGSGGSRKIFTETRLPTEGSNPRYPAFNDSWPDQVQIAWLENYKESVIASCYAR